MSNQLYNIIQTADANSVGNKNDYIAVDGDFVVQINAVKMVQSSKNKMNYFAAIEFTIKSSNNEHIVEGKTYAQIIKMSWETAPATIKRFIVIACGGDPLTTDLEPENIQQVFEGGALEGTVLRLSTRLVPTQSGKQFTEHRWEHVSEEEQEQWKAV